MHRLFTARCVLFSGFVACVSVGAATPPRMMSSVFLGHPFETWKVVGGEAKFEFDMREPARSVLTGRGPISKNGFLVSPFDLCDFFLEVEVKIGTEMNSGIQIRSRVEDDAVRGLQVEIDPSDRKWSGGIYDEGGRGWLASLKDNPAAQAAFKVDDWNLYRIECEGPSIRTWINRVPCAHWLECKSFRGVLAFQVHSGPKCEVAWRNPRFVPRGGYAWLELPADAHKSEGGLHTITIPTDCQGIAIDGTGPYIVRCSSNLNKEVVAIEADLSPIEGDTGAAAGEMFVVWSKDEGKAQNSSGSIVFPISKEFPVTSLQVRSSRDGSVRSLRALLPTQTLPSDR